MDEIVENWVKDGSGISNESPKGLVFNQAPGGYKYGAGGGGMYWGTSSSTTGSVSMGVSMNSKTISFSVSYALRDQDMSLLVILKLVQQAYVISM